MKTYKIGYIILLLFCFLRPLTVIDTGVVIGGLNFFEIFAVGISYILLFDVILNVLKVRLDFISLTILLFCLYCFASLLWGSQIRIVAQATLPFVLYFSIRVNINDEDHIRWLIAVLIVAYSFPILGSFYQIVQGSSIKVIEIMTEIERYAGMYKKIHALASSMLFFSVVFYYRAIIEKVKYSKVNWILILLLILSFFCLFKTYSRSVYIGLIIFWVLSLWGYDKKYFSFALILISIIGLLYLPNLEQIFFKTQEFDINTASSGRYFIWKHNLKIFLESSWERKISGHGFGVVSAGVIGGKNEIWSSHNDYLHVLMALGILGLVLYLLIYASILIDVFVSTLNRRTKFFYYGIIFAMITINFLSGVTLYQVGISQQFWLVIGLFYVLREFDFKSNKTI